MRTYLREDYTGNYSLKLVSSSRSDYCTLPLDAFWLSNKAVVSSDTLNVNYSTSL